MSIAQLKPTNLKELYFNHQTLNRISGNPTYYDVQKLYKKSKVSVQSVPLTHGGGSNGHLGLIINTTAYDRINPETAYARPTLPAALGSPPHNITQD